MNNKNQTKPSNGLSIQSFKKKFNLTEELNYFLYLPLDYQDSKKDYPLLLFLHGAGERGTDLEKVKTHGPVKYAKSHKDFPFILVAPQCTEDSWWTEHLDGLIALVDEIIDNYRVDKESIYLTGLSMGGEGAWKLALKYPHRFAAMIPICGKTIPSLAKKIIHLPIWVFHGDKDEIIAFKESENMVNALKNLSGNIRFTVYPGVDHDSWTQTYNNPEIYTWLLKHKLSK